MVTMIVEITATTIVEGTVTATAEDIMSKNDINYLMDRELISES